MNALSVNVQYRPIRIGWCIRENNLQDYKKALQLTHTLWGGRYNPLIPIGNIDFAKQLVDFFELDLLYPIDNQDPTLTTFVKQYPHLPWPDILDHKLFVKRGYGYNESVFLDIQQAACSLHSDLQKENKFSEVQLNLTNWDKEDPLALIFEAMFGSYSSPDEWGINYNELMSRIIQTNQVNLAIDKEVPSSIVSGFTRNSLTCHALRTKKSYAWNDPGFYIGDAKNFNDLVTFWNLRACNTQLFFYDPSAESRLIQLREEHLNYLRNADSRNPGLISSVGLWGQEEQIEKIDKQIFGENISCCFPSIQTWNGLNLKPAKAHFKPKTTLGSVSESNLKTLSFPLPEKPVCDDVGFFQYFVATIQVFGGLFEEEQTFHAPCIPELNEFYGRNCYYIWNKVRVEPNGLGIIITAHDSSVTLRSMDVTKLIQKIFSTFGMRADMSDAGKKTKRIIKQLGSIQASRLFKIQGVRKLLEKYKPTSSFIKSEAMSVIGKNNFKKYNRLFLSERSIDQDLQVDEVFCHLVNKGIFNVGLEFRCSNCELNFWNSLDEIRSNVICEFCGSEVKTASQLERNSWRYRRSGIFGLEDHQGGGIPVALTMQQLQANSLHDSFLYTTSMSINPKSKGAAIDGCESDFVVITSDRSGNISLIISECKTKQEITDKDVDNLIKVANAFSTHRIKTYILFSKLGEFSNVEIERCKRAQDPYRNRVIMLTSRELESWFIYQETEKLFEIKKHASGWDDLALNTVAIFFEKQLKTEKQDLANK